MDGDNIYTIMGEASAKLEVAGHREVVKKMRGDVSKAQSYDDACEIVASALTILDTEAESDADWDRYWAECAAANAAMEG